LQALKLLLSGKIENKKPYKCEALNRAPC